MFDPKLFLSCTYTKEDVFKALSTLGIKKGDSVLIHSSLFDLGLPDCNIVNLDEFYLECIKEYLGADGTIILPAFTYSFCKGKVFDLKKDLSSVSSLSNYCIQNHIGYRTQDAIFSYVIISNDIEDKSFSNVCFDIEGGLAGYALLKNTKILMLGISFAWLTAFYSIDQELNVEHRFFKKFDGNILIDNKLYKKSFYYFCRHLVDNTINDNDLIHKKMLENDFAKEVALGTGKIFAANMDKLFASFRSYVKQDPWYFLKGPKLLLKAKDSIDIKKEYLNVIKL